MMEGPPHHNLLAKPLRDMASVSTQIKLRAYLVAHSFNPHKEIAILVEYLQNLGRDLSALVPPLPHICKPAMIHRVLCWVVTEWNNQRSRKQGLAATEPVQSTRTPLADLWRETIQNLTTGWGFQ